MPVQVHYERRRWPKKRPVKSEQEKEFWNFCEIVSSGQGRSAGMGIKQIEFWILDFGSSELFNTIQLSNRIPQIQNPQSKL